VRQDAAAGPCGPEAGETQSPVEIAAVLFTNGAER
jgi:hypothetical protein